MKLQSRKTQTYTTHSCLYVNTEMKFLQKSERERFFSSFLVFTFNRKWTIDCYHSELRPAYNSGTCAVYSDSTPHLTLTSRPPGPAWWWSLPAVRSHTQRSSHSPLLHTSTLPPVTIMGNYKMVTCLFFL